MGNNIIHAKRIKTKKHLWKKFEDGEIDFSAWDWGFCSGPACLVCYKTFCVFCVDRDEGEDGVQKILQEEKCEPHFICSECGQLLNEDTSICPKCGAVIDS